MYNNICLHCWKNHVGHGPEAWDNLLCPDCAAEFKECVLDLSVANQIESLSDCECFFRCLDIGLEFYVDTETVSDYLAKISTSEIESDYDSEIESDYDSEIESDYDSEIESDYDSDIEE